MNAGEAASWFDEGAGYLVRPYAITGGRTEPDRSDFTLITLVLSSPSAVTSRRLQEEQPELKKILQLCQDRPLAIVEVAARLDLPASVVAVLCSDLHDRSMISISAPRAESGGPSVEVLERIIDGIRAL